jgi:signal transduction histidine kinase
MFLPIAVFAKYKWQNQIDSLISIEQPYWNFSLRKIRNKIPEAEHQKFFDKTIQQAEKVGNYELIASIYLKNPFFEGASAYDNEQYKNIFKSIEYFEKAGLKDGIVEAYIMLGLNHKSLDDLKKMNEYYRLANKYAQTSNEPYLNLIGYWTMFELMNYTNNLDSAEYYMHICDSIKAICSYPSSREEYHSDVLLKRFKSIYYAKKQMIDSSLYYFVNSVNSYQKENLPKFDELKYYAKDFAVAIQSLIEEVNDDEVVESFKSGLIADTLIKEDFLYHKIYRSFANYYVRKDMPDSAYLYFQKALIYYDSAYYNDPRVALTRFEQEKAEIEYQAEMKLAEQQQKYIIYGAIAALILILLATWFIYSRYRDKVKLNEKLNELNSTKDKLFAIISHDLKGPLSSIKQMLEQISKLYYKLSDEDKQKYINNLSISSNKMYLMMDNLLQWSKLNLGGLKYSPSSIDIEKIIMDQYELQKEEYAKKKINFNFTNEFNDKFEADKDLLSVAIRNLLSNALKFSPKGDTVECRVLNTNGTVNISIKDNGEGMDSKTIDQINNGGKIDSKHGTNHEKGNGLGLMITKEVVKMHNGELLIKSELTKYTEITIKLPVNNNK